MAEFSVITSLFVRRNGKLPATFALSQKEAFKFKIRGISKLVHVDILSLDTI